MCWLLLIFFTILGFVSVAGCLGYDVLEAFDEIKFDWSNGFSCWLFRL